MSFDVLNTASAAAVDERAERPIRSMGVVSFALKVALRPVLRSSALLCVRHALVDFFGVQWHERVSPRRTAISSVDHELDSLVPFAPGYVGIYMDFIPFWIRTAAWLRFYYGKKADRETAGFVRGIASLYRIAASVYYARLSTTKRPFYVKRPRFALIHLTDPHYACVPSLHVMIVVYAWLSFRAIVRRHEDDGLLRPRILELRAGAMAITESILYVKQHSVNCISAALYVIAILFPGLLPQEEAELFISELFLTQPKPLAADAAVIRAHILHLFRRFMNEGRAAADWRKPLLDFLCALEVRPGRRSSTAGLLKKVPRFGEKEMG
ncbi:MAG: hypothetical protein KKC64_15720 [Spirochaetes bacterium]|nr:hypothetical protein [Spirochaetota bacterium]